MRTLDSVTIDPLQDVAVVVFTTDAKQDRYVFSVSFRLASSQLPHPDSPSASLECKHPCDITPGTDYISFVGQPAICGDRIIVLYYIDCISSPEFDIFIQVIDWRKGHAKGFHLCEPGDRRTLFHLVDEQTTIIVSQQGRMTLYTFQELDGPPQCQIVYLLPNVQQGLRFYHSPETLRTMPLYVAHVTPSFRGAAARPELMPNYVTSLGSQIMVLEVISSLWQVISVIDMAIFKGQDIHSVTPVEIPWSDWGHKCACCFPHHPSHRISVFGSKMAYALLQDRTPEPGQRLEGLSMEGFFYVHIRDFNRAITRLEKTHDPDSLDRLIRRPVRIAQSCFVGDDIITNHPHITSVCPAPFSTGFFDRFFLEQDRLTLTWARPDSVHTQVVSPVPMDVGLNVGQGKVARRILGICMASSSCKCADGIIIQV